MQKLVEDDVFEAEDAKLNKELAERQAEYALLPEALKKKQGAP